MTTLRKWFESHKYHINLPNGKIGMVSASGYSSSGQEERLEDKGRITGGWEEEIIKYWIETKEYGKKEIKDMGDEEKGRYNEILERTATLERGRRVEGIMIEQMMELIYLRIATTSENRDEDTERRCNAGEFAGKRETRREEENAEENMEQQEDDQVEDGRWRY